MFVITTVFDVIRIPPSLLPEPTLQAIHNEIDKKYPNRILPDVGLVICRYGDCVRVGNGVCVAGDGGSHHECKFRLVVFRPFVEEVCLGKIKKSSAEGVQVSLGFFDDIFIPAYWMLRPSTFEQKTGLWVWTPRYDDDEEDENGGEDRSSQQPTASAEAIECSQEGKNLVGEEDNRYEMEVGAEIRFKVKSINFTQVTDTVKGRQATTTTTAHSSPSSSFGMSNNKTTAEDSGAPVRLRRSSSVGIDETRDPPPPMHIVGSICEDGLGLTNWWSGGDEEEDPCG